MRKCSTTPHQSLSELNITPLLDLGFVLLVIFIITTIPPVNDEDLKLPSAAKRLKEPPREAHYISVLADGNLFLDKQAEASPSDMLQTLINLRMDIPDLNIIVRGDGKTKYSQIRAVLDVCQQANVLNVKLATEPLPTK